MFNEFFVGNGMNIHSGLIEQVQENNIQHSIASLTGGSGWYLEAQGKISLSSIKLKVAGRAGFHLPCVLHLPSPFFPLT